MNDQFYALSPDLILNSVEAFLRQRCNPDLYKNVQCTGRIGTLNSLENRVFEIEVEGPGLDTSEGPASVVAKFYRPGRWSKEQILEEHRFIAELKKVEIPAVAPLGELDCTSDGIYFVAFPKIRGRLKDELQSEELRQLGRFLAQLHSVGERFKSRHRIHLNVDTYGRDSLDALLETSFIDPALKGRYEELCLSLFDSFDSLFEDTKLYATHGDCHVGNILWNENGPFLLDFDDMVVAPRVQDLWMINPGRDEYSLKLRDELITGYEMMKDFDHSELGLVEALRALRMIHYSAWIAKRWDDPCFPRMFANFGSQQYWLEEIQALDEIRQLMFQNF